MTQSAPRLALIGAPLPNAYEHADRFESAEELLACAPYDAVVVNVSAAETGPLVQRLRRHGPYMLCPIYSTAPEHGATLSDGPPPANTASLNERHQRWQERLALFNRGRFPQGLEAKILAFMWLRAPGALNVERDAGAPQFYRYPLLDGLSAEPINAGVWVNNLAQRGLIESTRLVDRIRLCNHCGSARLNYVDTCVECHSIDIRRQPSLHCFTCGHVGHQEDFLKDGALVCPNCLSRLRHIGTDYDRPLENYHCNACSAFFVDADVEAHCLDCGTHHTPPQLHVREVRNFQLSEAGLLACRQGLDQAGEDYFGRLSMVGTQSFKTLLDWQLELIQRHKGPSFALLGIRFRNLGRTLERLGQQRGHALMDTLIERMQEAIRDTDRCTRTSEEHLWLLLMHTEQQGIDRVNERLEKLSKLFVGEELREIEIRRVACIAPRDLVADENAELLLARLTGEL